MDMIRLNSQGKQDPSLLFAFLFNELLATLFDLADQNGFTTAWAPDQVIDNQMNPVLITLIL